MFTGDDWTDHSIPFKENILNKKEFLSRYSKDFVFLNMESMVCHDSIIGAFSTLAPRATVAGNVKVGEGCYLGISSTS